MNVCEQPQLIFSDFPLECVINLCAVKHHSSRPWSNRYRLNLVKLTEKLRRKNLNDEKTIKTFLPSEIFCYYLYNENGITKRFKNTSAHQLIKFFICHMLVIAFAVQN